MIALVPSADDASRLVLPGHEPVDELHLTLWYLGEAASHPADTFDGLVNAITSMIEHRDEPEARGVAFGVDLWNPNGDEPAWVYAVGDDANADVEHLGYYRGMVNEAWFDGGVKIDLPKDMHTPWVPHVCAAYAPSTAGLIGQMAARLGPITFDRVRVAFADRVADVQLGTARSTLTDMPWHKVHNHSGCPSSKPWAVVKNSDDSVAGCHASEADADKQLAALYAQESTVAEDTGTVEQLAATDAVPEPVVETITLADAPSDVVDPPVEEAATVSPWTGPICVEGVTTGDGREFAVDALTWADPPLPLRWNKEDSHGGEKTTVAVNVGRIDQVWRDENNRIMASGVINLGEEDGRRVYELLKGNFLRGVSIDADDIGDADIEYVWPETGDETTGEEDGMDILSVLFATPEKVVYHAGRIRAATLCDIPAFVEAYVALDETAVDSLAASAAPIKTFNLDSVDASDGLVTLGDSGWAPPRSWFSDPQLPVIVPLTVTSEGRIYGHAAQWGQCHIGIQNECVTPPRESDHPYFMMGELVCADGTVTRVGQITVNTNHAAPYLDAVRAVDHYANTGTVVADVAVGNDSHGIWMAGAVRPSATSEQVHALRAAGQVSGDWRRIGGQLRLAEQQRGAGLGEDARVVGLVVGGRGREWNQDARQPPRAQLGHRDHAGARHHEIGNRIPVGHRIQKVDHLHRGRTVTRREFRVGPSSRDPEQIGAARSTPVEPLGDRTVDREGALATPGHEDHRAAAVQPEAREGLRAALGRGRRDRIAGIEHLGVRAEPKQAPRLGQPEVDVPYPPAEPTGGESGIRVLFLYGRGNAPPRSRPDDRRGGVSARAEHRRRPLGGEQLGHLAEQPTRHERPARVAPPGAAVDRLGRKQVVAEVASRQDTRLDPADRTDEHGLDLGCMLAQGLRDRERRHQVPAGAAPGDEDTLRGMPQRIPPSRSLP